MSSDMPASICGAGCVSCGAGSAEPGGRALWPPIRPPLSVGCTITGRSFVGSPPIVGWTILPEPFRTTTTRSASPAFIAIRNRPHFISAFSTSSRAFWFAMGEVSDVPASGSINTNTVSALRTYAGRTGFLSPPAKASEVDRARIAATRRKRMNIRASLGWKVHHTPSEGYLDSHRELVEIEGGCLQLENKVPSPENGVTSQMDLRQGKLPVI